MSNRSLRERFAEIATDDDEVIDLAEAALLIAAEAYQDLDVTKYLAKLDALAQRGSASFSQTASSEARAQQLVDFLSVTERFAGNQDDYYDPRNSFFNEVLDRHTGIPITLTLVYMEVARRLDLPVEGVGFPGHFLAKFVGDQEIIIDPFFGQILTEQECAQRLRAVHGPGELFDRRYLQSATSREILVRMLTNLKQIHLRRREFELALGCSDRILLLVPDTPPEVRDRGLLYQQLECYAAAQADLERFLELAPNDETVATVRRQLISVRRRAAHIH